MKKHEPTAWIEGDEPLTGWAAPKGTRSVFLLEVAAEFTRAVKKHGPMHSAHEAYAVILEEMDEFKNEVWKQGHDKAAMRAELVQLAAMCMRAVEDLGL